MIQLFPEDNQVSPVSRIALSRGIELKRLVRIDDLGNVSDALALSLKGGVD